MNRKWLLFSVLLAFGFSCKRDAPKPAYPTEGLISYFNFDDQLTDQRHQTADGIASGNPEFIQSEHGKAISFNGIDQRINFTKNDFLPSTQLSVSLWVKAYGSVNSSKRFLVASQLLSFVAFFQDHVGDVGMSIQADPNGTNNAKTFVPLNQWTHLVGTYDGEFIKVYVNGELKAIKSHAGTIKGYVDDLIIGGYNQDFWAGSIDELFIYHRALTPAEVTQLYTLK